jgi:hypothetical protein
MPVLVVIDEIDGATGDNVSSEILMSAVSIKLPLSRPMGSLTNSSSSPMKSRTSPAVRRKEIKANEPFDARLSAYVTTYMRRHWPNCDL